MIAAAPGELEAIQAALYSEARDRRDAAICRDVSDFSGLEQFFKADVKFPGWVELAWSRPTGAALDGVVERLKALKLTIRNTPMDDRPVTGTCLFTGEPAIERILIARAY